MAALTTGRYFEGPRWRDGFLWLVDSLARTVLRIDSNGHCETRCEVPDVPAGMGFLPTGETVVTAMFQRSLLSYSGGRVTTYADLSNVARGTIDDMIMMARDAPSSAISDSTCVRASRPLRPAGWSS